ncbi:MAG: GNAT family N-acetyltransferase [Candidatus Hermodarchaeota archaeon]
MRIAFITEGGKDFGMGHVFRTLTLAGDLGKGIDIRFFSRSEEVTIRKIEECGFNVGRYTTPEKLIQKLMNFGPDSVVFDCLDVDPMLARKIKQSSKAKIVIFDNETQANRHADIVINALITKDFTNRKFLDDQNQTMFMLGPRYLVLNRLFRWPESTTKRSPDQARRLLLAFGGSDPSNKTTFALDRILQHIARDENPIEIDVVLGPHFEYDDELNQILRTSERRLNVLIHRNLANLFELIHKADLVITSPGLTMFESLTERSHVVVMYQNELQKRVYSDLFRKIGSDPKFFGLSELGYHLDPNTEIVANMQIGKGREEVLEAIFHVHDDAAISLRQVTDNDLKMIMDWRSDPSVYQYFYNQNEALIWDEHLEWWSSRNDRVDWIILLNEHGVRIPVGSINCVDLNGDSPEIGLFVGNKSQWGKSIGKQSVKLVVAWLRKRGYEKALARVIKENKRSKRLFESLGFMKKGYSRPGEILYLKEL